MVDMDMIYIDLIQMYIILFVMMNVPIFYLYIQKKIERTDYIYGHYIISPEKKVVFMFLKEKEENINLG